MELKELKEFAAKMSERLQANYLNGCDEEKRIYHACVKLNEEAGELCGAVLKKLGTQRSKKLESFNQEEIETEIADVVFVVAILAQELNIDLETALKNKMSNIDARYNKDGEELNV